MDGWQTDEDGRRFRIRGFLREYEPEISINGVMVPVSQREEALKRIAENEEKRKKEQAEKLKKSRKTGDCPFKSFSKCSETCAFYSGEGCMESNDTKGKRCPISNYSCRENCMLYQDGCQIIKKWKGNK